MPSLADVETVARRKLELLEWFQTTKTNRARLVDAINSTLLFNARLHAAGYVDLPGFDAQAWVELAAGFGFSTVEVDRFQVTNALCGIKRRETMSKPNKSVSPDDKRNGFIYNAIKENKSTAWIASQLRRHPTWNELTGRQAILNAADRFAEDHSLPFVRRRPRRRMSS